MYLERWFMAKKNQPTIEMQYDIRDHENKTD